MGRKLTFDEASPFYPPRARWTSAFYYTANGLRRRVGLDRLAGSEAIQVRALVAGFFVPGLAVYLRQPRLWGQAALLAAGLLFLIGLAWLGRPAANIAFGLLLSLHTTGFGYYCSPIMAKETLSARLLFTFLLLVALLLLWYRPVENFTQRHLFAPVVTGGRVVIVQPGASLRGLQRGDWVAYTLAERSIEDAVIFHGGVGLGPVLAKAGDRIVFSPGGFTVNETPHAALPHMPAAGEWIVPEKHWFIWPNLGISGHGNVGESNINRTFMALADVAPSQYWGRPFGHWFWRKQTLP